MKIKNTRKTIALILTTIIAIMMFGVNTNVFAEGETVAKIGDTEYATVKEAFDASQNGDTITLIADAHVTERINVQSKVTLNLNGKVLTLDCDGTSAGKARKIFNYGELTITGNGTMQNQLGAYGMVDNFGTLNIENGTFIDNGGGDGSSFRTNAGAQEALIYVKDGIFKGEVEKYGNAFLYCNPNGTIIVDGGTYTSESNRAYAFINNGGDFTVNDANVYCKHGAVGVSSGFTEINNGTFEAGNYYGLWVTNNGTYTGVTVNDGTFIGKIYGLNASVDDSNQDRSNVSIVVNKGNFTGDTAAVKNNKKTTQHIWDLQINGGTYSSSVSDFIPEDEGIEEFKIEDRYHVLKNIYLDSNTYFNKQVGKTVDLEIKLSNDVLKDLVVTEIMDNDTAKELPQAQMYEDSLNDKAITLENGIVTAKEPGLAFIRVAINDGEKVTELEPICIAVYDIAPNNDQSEADKAACEVFFDSLNNQENPGFTEEEAEEVIMAIITGKNITTEVVTEPLQEPDKEDTKLVEEKVEEGQKLAGYYDISVLVKANGEEIAKLRELGQKIKVQLEVSKDLPAVASGFSRTYSVIRVHDGKAEIIEEGLTANNGKITIETDKFSTYAVTYTDTVTTNPKTGDAVVFIGIGMVIAMFSVVVIRKIRK